MDEKKDMRKVHELSGFLKEGEGVRVEEEQAQAVLDFLWLIEDGYEMNPLEKECLRGIGEFFLRYSEVTSLPESIVELKNLLRLDVSYTRLSSLPESIVELKNLQGLNVSGTRLSSLPESIVELKNLQDLDVGNTSLSSLPERIGKLANLSYLNVSGTRLSSLPESIVELKNLQGLDVSNTGMTSLPDSIGKLTNLSYLNVSNTGLTSLPDSIEGLTNLQELLVNSTSLTGLPDSVGKLTNLEKLDVSHTGLTSLPDCIGKLTNLQELYLGNNPQIKRLSLTALTGLKNLRTLDLCNLHLYHIPKNLVKLGLHFNFDRVRDMGRYVVVNKKSHKMIILGGIRLSGATLATQPINLFTQPRELIEAYYAEKMVRLSEAKVIFLGYGGAGKTYTIKRILNSGKRGEYVTEPTPGIDIQPYEALHAGKELNVQFWDFGGQEIMHAMHRCFLTGRTCYVVVVDNREGRKMTEKAEYWLRNIQSFAPNCPVLLAVNRIEGVTDVGIDAPKLKKEFCNLVGDPIYYSAKTSTEEEFGRLTDTIYEQASLLDSYGMEFPKSWANIRKEIESRSASTYCLDNAEYHQICKDNGLTDSDIRKWLLEWFNDLGVCFSYHLDEAQKELLRYQLLNPKWLTNALYIIINTCRGLSRHGVIFHELIDGQLNNTAIDKTQRVFEEFVEYSQEQRDYILQIMRKFRLSYQVSDTEEFIPALCQDETPNEINPTNYLEYLNYEIIYTYLPDTVIHRLMILCYEHLNLKKTWNKGFCIEVDIDNITAVVEMKNNTTLGIDVYTLSGNVKPWKVLAYLRGHILNINKDLNITAHDRVIVEDNTLNWTRHAHIPVKTLLDAKKDGVSAMYKDAIEDQSGMTVQVDEILGTVFGEETMRQAEEDAKRLGVSLVELLLQIRNYVAEINEGQVEIRDIGRGVAGYAAVTAYNTKKAAERASEISEHTESVEVSLKTVVSQNEAMIAQNETIIQNQKLALELIEKLKQNNRSDLQNLAEQMQQAMSQKKSPWELFGEFLGNGANFLTIVSTLGAFVLEIVKADVVQGISGYVMLGLKFFGKLFQLWSKIKGDGTGIA